MRPYNKCLGLTGLAASLFLNGCATFKPTLAYQDLINGRPATVKQEQKDLEISVEEFISSEKSRQVFDADIASYGVLALFFRIENRGAMSYMVRDSESKAFLGPQSLALMQGVDAANQSASSNAVGKAAAWTVATGPMALIFWPVSISVSGAHTGYVNEEIGHYFDNLQLGNVLIRPTQTMGGFLYFKIPNGTKKLEGLTVEVVASEEKTQERLTFRLSLPTLELPAPVLSVTEDNATSDTEPGSQ